MRILDRCISGALYKIFGVSDNESMLHMRHCLGLPSLMNMIENRLCKFMDRLLGDGSFTVMCNVCNVLGFNFLVCFSVFLCSTVCFMFS